MDLEPFFTANAVPIYHQLSVVTGKSDSGQRTGAALYAGKTDVGVWADMYKFLPEFLPRASITWFLSHLKLFHRRETKRVRGEHLHMTAGW